MLKTTLSIFSLTRSVNDIIVPSGNKIAGRVSFGIDDYFVSGKIKNLSKAKNIEKLIKLKAKANKTFEIDFFKIKARILFT